MINAVTSVNNKVDSVYYAGKSVLSDSGQFESENLKKAKAALYQSGVKNPDQRAINLIIMAENALKNGNTIAADNFADKAMQFLTPDTQVKLQQKKIDKPDTVKFHSQNNDVIERPKHTTHMYQDVSNDAGVSFSSPSSLTGPESFLAVPAHEAEHVARSISDAVLNGERVLVTVSYRINYDPETGEAYMAGGTTRTIKFAHFENKTASCGANVDLYA